MKLIQGDCLEKLKKLDDNSVDSVVTDPPYGWSFMGKKWDYDVPKVEVWQEVLRVLKPGGHALVACGTRTQHRMAVNLEDAGFEIRDVVAWVYGSGFSKSLNIGKAVDKLQGNKHSKRGSGDRVTTNAMGTGLKNRCDKCGKPFFSANACKCPKPTYDNEWNGWGTALKPAMELWTLCRKPLSEKTVAKNVLKWGVGGINIDGCRVEVAEQEKESFAKEWDREQSMSAELGGVAMNKGLKAKRLDDFRPTGRFPANFIHDGSDEVVRLFPNTGKGNGGKPYSYFGKEYKNKETSMFNGDKPQAPSNFNDSGSASRFFYCAKASKRERNEGLDGFEKGCVHPTVKPIALMRYLTKLITPPGKTVLDPFMGSGTTGIACKLEGFDFIGIEIDPEYFEIAKARIEKVKSI